MSVKTFSSVRLQWGWKFALICENNNVMILIKLET